MKAIIAAIVILVLGAGGFYVWQEMQKTETTDDAEIDGSIVTISPRIPGHVAEVTVEDQQLVKAGDVLVRLDPKDFDVAIARAQADLADAVASLEGTRTDIPLTTATTGSTLNGAKSQKQDAEAGVRWAERQINVAQARRTVAEANVKAAEANAAKVAQDVERYRGLAAKDMIPRQQFDQAVASLTAANALIEVQKAGVVEAQQQILSAELAIAQARAKVAQAEAGVEGASTGPQQVAITESRAKAGNARVMQRRVDLERAQLNASYTTIVAPVSGIVGRKSVNVGQNVAAGQQMMVVVPLDNLYVTANFKETQLKNIKPGQPVTITVDAYGREYKGKVERFAGASGAKFSLLPPENATGNYVKVVQRIPVRISIEPGQDPDHMLRPGMSVVPEVKIK